MPNMLKNTCAKVLKDYMSLNLDFVDSKKKRERSFRFQTK